MEAPDMPRHKNITAMLDQCERVGECLIAQGANYKWSRVFWTFVRGPIPAGMCVCHACDNPRCVEVDHLWLGTTQDNQQDAIRKGRQNPRRLAEESAELTHEARSERAKRMWAKRSPEERSRIVKAGWDVRPAAIRSADAKARDARMGSEALSRRAAKAAATVRARRKQ